MSAPDIERLRVILKKHDAGELGYQVGDRRLFDELLAALGWKGGVVWHALREARRRTA